MSRLASSSTFLALLVASLPAAAEPTPSPAAAKPASAHVASAPPAQAPAASPPGPVPVFGMQLEYALGAVPRDPVGFGATLDGGLEWPDSSLLVELALDGGAGVVPNSTTYIFSGRVMPCLRRAGAFGCMMAQAGSRVFTSANFTTTIVPEVRDPMFFALGLRAGFEYRNDKGSGNVHVDIVGSFPSTRVFLDGKEIWRSPTVWFVMGFGPMVRLFLPDDGR